MSRSSSRRARPLESAVDRCLARVEQLRHLAGLPAQRVAEDQHGALLRRQVLQRGDERQLERLLRRGGLRRVGAVVDTRPSGIGIDPLALGEGRRERLDHRRARLAQLHRPDPSAPCRSARPCTRSSRCCTPTTGAASGPRTCRARATRGASSPAPRPRPRRPSRASGSSSPSARGGTPRGPALLGASRTAIGSIIVAPGFWKRPRARWARRRGFGGSRAEAPATKGGRRAGRSTTARTPSTSSTSPRSTVTNASRQSASS